MIILFLIILYIAFILCIGAFMVAIKYDDDVGFSFMLMVIFGAMAICTHILYNNIKYTSYHTISRTTVPVDHRSNISIIASDKYAYTDTSVVFRQSDSAYIDSIQVLYKNNIKDTIIKVKVKINDD